MYKLKMADGTEISVNLCGAYGDDSPLYIEVCGSDFVTCAQIFSDPAKTSTMIYDYVVAQDTFEGYTRLSGLVAEGNIINVTMRKAVAA